MARTLLFRKGTFFERWLLSHRWNPGLGVITLTDQSHKGDMMTEISHFELTEFGPKKTYILRSWTQNDFLLGNNAAFTCRKDGCAVESPLPITCRPERVRIGKEREVEGGPQRPRLAKTAFENNCLCSGCATEWKGKMSTGHDVSRKLIRGLAIDNWFYWHSPQQCHNIQ